MWPQKVLSRLFATNLYRTSSQYFLRFLCTKPSVQSRKFSFRDSVGEGDGLVRCLHRLLENSFPKHTSPLFFIFTCYLYPEREGREEGVFVKWKLYAAQGLCQSFSCVSKKQFSQLKKLLFLPQLYSVFPPMGYGALVPIEAWACIAGIFGFLHFLRKQGLTLVL